VKRGERARASWGCDVVWRMAVTNSATDVEDIVPPWHVYLGQIPAWGLKSLKRPWHPTRSIRTFHTARHTTSRASIELCDAVLLKSITFIIHNHITWRDVVERQSPTSLVKEITSIFPIRGYIPRNVTKKFYNVC
jgi:hypothetical protein